MYQSSTNTNVGNVITDIWIYPPTPRQPQPSAKSRLPPDLKLTLLRGSVTTYHDHLIC